MRDNFRIEWKKIPRDENDSLLIPAEEFTGSKWQYYFKLVFLANHMRTRNQIALGSSENVKFETVIESDEAENVNGTTESQEDTEDEEEEEFFELDRLPPLIPISDWQPRPHSSQKFVERKDQYSPPGSTSQTYYHANEKQQRRASQKRKMEEPSTSIENLDLSRDDDYCFLMSLYPYLQLKNGPSNLKLRIKIQRLLYKELFKDDCDEEK